MHDCLSLCRMGLMTLVGVALTGRCSWSSVTIFFNITSTWSARRGSREAILMDPASPHPNVSVLCLSSGIKCLTTPRCFTTSSSTISAVPVLHHTIGYCCTYEHYNLYVNHNHNPKHQCSRRSTTLEKNPLYRPWLRNRPCTAQTYDLFCPVAAVTGVLGQGLPPSALFGPGFPDQPKHGSGPRSPWTTWKARCCGECNHQVSGQILYTFDGRALLASVILVGRWYLMIPVSRSSKRCTAQECQHYLVLVPFSKDISCVPCLRI